MFTSIRGVKGDKGVTGNTGDTGATGATGAKGDKGDQGDAGANEVYVDRGDPANPDFTKDSFTKDNSWRDLSLTSQVPEGVTNVHFRCRGRATASGDACLFRKKGNSNEVNIRGFRSVAANEMIYQSFRLECDVNRAIQYKVGSNYTHTADLTVIGWWTV